jgi:hypothetical protein
MPKPELEFLNADTAFPWSEIGGGQGGVWEKILSRDADGGRQVRA